MSFDYDTLVTDRTEEDVAHVKELAAKGWSKMTAAEREEWNSGAMKGAYNASDWNRVREAMLDLVYRCREFGYQTVGFIDPAAIWVGGIPDEPTTNAYINDAKAIKNIFKTPVDLPDSIKNLTYTGANGIELMLYEVNYTLVHMIDGFRRLNTLGGWAGQIALPAASHIYGNIWKNIEDSETTWDDIDGGTWYAVYFGNLGKPGAVDDFLP